MLSLRHFLSEIDKAITANAREALSRTEGDTFAYGKHCGIQVGLEAARGIVERVFKENDDTELD